MAILPSPPATSQRHPLPVEATRFSTTEYVLLDPRPRARGEDSIPLTIPLDIEHPNLLAKPRKKRELLNSESPGPDNNEGVSLSGIPAPSTTAVPAGGKGKPILRRDSLKRREALLKGKEGSRRRQRWENDRLLSNPYFQPPSPNDWSPVPLPNPHPHKLVRYELATLWDHPTFQARVYQNQQHRMENSGVMIGNHECMGKMPRELKERLKKARGAVGLLRSLEEEVRAFIVEQVLPASSPTTTTAAAAANPPTTTGTEFEPDKEQITFKPKSKSKSKPSPTSPSSTSPTIPLHQSPLSDPSASFTRWLIHSIAKYYGLKSWSVTTPYSVRVAYVGMAETKVGARGKQSGNGKAAPSQEMVQPHMEPFTLPRPLWGML